MWNERIFLYFLRNKTRQNFNGERRNFSMRKFRWRKNEKLFQTTNFRRKITENRLFFCIFRHFWGVFVSHETQRQNRIVPRETYTFEPFLPLAIPLFFVILSGCSFLTDVLCYFQSVFCGFLPFLHRLLSCSITLFCRILRFRFISSQSFTPFSTHITQPSPSLVARLSPLHIRSRIIHLRLIVALVFSFAFISFFIHHWHLATPNLHWICRFGRF